MTFNWFRRPLSESTENQENQVENPVVEENTSPETTIDTADLLAFAKAAYKNIQEKQEQQTEEITTTEESTTETVENVVIEDITENQSLETTTTPSENIETTVAEQPEISAPKSFLERAAAEQQAKQERLIATAIEEIVEPPTQQISNSTDTEITSAIPELVFDDGFVWSAEVLAAQGRKAEDISIEEITWLKKLRQGLDKTRRSIVNQLKSIVGQGPLNQAAVTEIESLLLQADVGVEATDYIINTLQNKLREEVTEPEQAIAYLKKILRDMLDTPMQKAAKPGFAPEKDTLNIWLMTGINGAGKTTTIGKIAHLAQKSGYRCLIGAADTFRAAAVEQVKVWGGRSGVEVIANPGKNTDPAAVVFDAIAAAQARETELLLIDTAGRLQNKKNLMDELAKVRKIIDKKAPNAHIESLLVLDATLGQNGLRQAEVFSQAAQLSGVVLTKLDGTAKGGVALAVVQQLGLPIRFIGAGEGIEDLRPFSSYEFVEALLSD
jgi:fused signal recognition particle receptor